MTWGVLAELTWYGVSRILSGESQETQSVRAILYVDGFNIYHPIRELRLNHLKWLDLWNLGELICQDRQHQLVGVTYCTAYEKASIDKKSRHKTYIEALTVRGVKTILGHYVEAESKPCDHCGGKSLHSNEKQTDINLALSVFNDARNDLFDWAYLLSADSDQAATARFLKECFPDKKLVTVVPPSKPVSDKVMNYADGKRKLNKEDIEKCRLPNYIQRPDGTILRCPTEYLSKP